MTAATISLRVITKETLHGVLALKVAPDQEQFVASNAVSLAEAHFEPVAPWYRAIYAGEVPVGFLMMEYNAAEAIYFLWRFMIDARFQSHGYGRTALELLFDHVRALPNADALYTSCVPAEGGPGPFYEKMGFVYTGEEEDGELGMRRALGYPRPCSHSPCLAPQILPRCGPCCRAAPQKASPF
ncbi:GNAT family N-acetyltransferase [Candidatus Gracilibacteria bacterium]|nr:GNAT family N-acetyltransferase [Candidatus Gracilibacteria bacterium]